jgi:hypothetical protein
MSCFSNALHQCCGAGAGTGAAGAGTGTAGAVSFCRGQNQNRNRDLSLGSSSGSGFGSGSGSRYKKGVKYGFNTLIVKGIIVGEQTTVKSFKLKSTCFHPVSKEILLKEILFLNFS